MPKCKTAILGLTVAAALGAGALADAGTAMAAGRARYHCPYGAFCIYPKVRGRLPTRPPVRERPERNGVYYTYGYHNLHRQYGWHFVFNNQYGGAGVSFCSGPGGTGVQIEAKRARGWGLVNMTPVNSITLWLYSPSYDAEFSCHM